MQGELIEEYNTLRASIIEKSMNELAKRNKESVSPEQKGAAKNQLNYTTMDYLIKIRQSMINLLIQPQGQV